MWLYNFHLHNYSFHSKQIMSLPWNLLAESLSAFRNIVITGKKNKKRKHLHSAVKAVLWHQSILYLCQSTDFNSGRFTGTAGIFYSQLHSSNEEKNKRPINPHGMERWRTWSNICMIRRLGPTHWTLNTDFATLGITDKQNRNNAKAFPHCSFLHCLCT